MRFQVMARRIESEEIADLIRVHRQPAAMLEAEQFALEPGGTRQIGYAKANMGHKCHFSLSPIDLQVD